MCAAAFGSSRSRLWHGGAHRRGRTMTAREPGHATFSRPPPSASQHGCATLAALSSKRESIWPRHVGRALLQALLRDTGATNRQSRRSVARDDSTTRGFAANLGALLRARSPPRPPLQTRTKAPSMDSRLEAGDPKGGPSRLSFEEKAPEKASPRGKTKPSTDARKRQEMCAVLLVS